MIDTKIKSQKQKMFLESAERTPHYGIRKFTVGVASALLSTTLWLGSAPSAQAATTGTGDVATSQTNNTAPAGQATEMQSQTEASAPAQSTAPAPQNESQKASESQAAGSTSTEAAEQAADSASADAQTEAASAQVKNQAPASTEASTDQVTTEAASQSSSSAHEKVAETQTQTEASTPAQNTAPATQAESQKASESQATASASTSATEQVADSANAQSQVENSTAASTQSEQTAPTAPAETTQATPATALTSGEAVSQKQENAGEAAAQDAQKALENSKETTGSVENTSSDAKANTLPGGVSVDNTVVDEKQASGNSTEKATTAATTTLNVSKLLRTSSFVASPANLAVSLAATNDSLTLHKNSLDSIGEYYYTFRKSVQGKPSITTSDKNWSVHQGKDGSWNIVYTRTFKVSGPNKYGLYNTGDLPAGDVTFTIKNAVHDESGKTYDMKVKLSNVYFKALGYKTNDSLIYNGKSVSWTVVDFTKDGYVWFRSGMGAAQSDGLYGNYRSGGRNDGKIGTRFDATVQVVGASTNNSKNAMPIYFRDLDQPDKTEGGEDHKAYLNEDGNVKRYTEKIQFLSGMIGNAHANTNSVVKEKGNTFYGLQELSDLKGSPDIEKGEFDQLVTADKFSFHWAASDAGTRVFANYGDHEITTTFVSGHNQGKYTHTGGNLDTVYMKRDRTVTVTPNSGYYIKSILVDGKEYLKNPGSTSNTSAVTVTFNNVTADHNVKTDIRKIPATDSQDATVIYHDDYTNTDLESKDLSGKSNADSGYNTKATISKYEGMGYKLVSDDTGGKNVVFDNDANVDQEYVVHLTHDKRESKGKDTDVVSRTIHYVVNGGSATAPADVHDSLNFTATVIKDAVTGDTISIDWEGAKDFKDVTSPTLQGYSVDRQVVSNTGVYHDWGDIYEVVTYRADTQKAHVKYVDDTDNKTLKTDDLQGESDTIAYKDGKQYLTADTIKGYVGQGYKLVSDSTNGESIMLDHVTGIDQFYEVHLVHDTYTKDVADDVHRTITYVVHGGNHSAPAPVGDNLHFTGVQTYDKVNNNLLRTDWEPNKDFADVTSPEIKGYTVDRQVVSNRNIAHDAADINEVVTYTAEKQYAHVKYVDDTDNKTLKTDDMEGESDTTAYKDGVPYTTAASIKDYISQGYKLVSDNTDGATIMLDHLTGVDQFYEVHLVHDTYTKDVADDVHRTVHYVVKGGNHAAPEDVEADLHFTGVQTWDKVTNGLLKTDWEPNKDFTDVDTPEIQGYTADRLIVSNRDISHDHADILEVVTYTADKQRAHVRYHDDTDNRDLKTVDLEGESDTTAYKDGVPYTTAASIKDYISQGYKLVSDNTDGATIMLDHLTGVDQFYEVHLVHDTYTKDVADDVHRTVHYVVKGGNHAAPEDVEADLHFTGVQTWDKVTNGLLKTDWEPNKDFTDVDTPEIQGYTADRLIVSNRDISHDHADILEVVTYTADKQRAHVRYHDDTDNRDLKTVDLEGDSDTLASLDGKPYTTEWQINYYIDRGYAKVSDDTNGMTIMLDHVTGTDQYYNVHLVHTYQTITPKNPGDPNKPINPKGDPNPVWPPDTGAKDLQHDVLRNIHYIVDGGMDKAPDDVNDLLHFEETRVYDKVNGKLISDEWSPKQDFKDITSPAITGYTVDREVVINHDIEHNHADIKEVVHYVPDPQKAFVTYIDHTTGDTLAIKELDGVTHAKSGYTTYPSIVYYQGLGYQFISDTTDGKEIVYDNDDKVDQYYTVYLEHSYVPASPQNPGKPGEPINQNPDGAVWPDGTDANSLQHDVNRTINYVVTGGKDKAPDSVSDKLHFEAVAMVDRVTGEIVSTKWDEDKDFSDVTSPEIKGYTVDRKVVSNKDIEHNAKDIVETVTYNPDAQKASVTYIDKTTGKTLKTDKLDGVTHADSGYNTKGAIAVYQGLGYALVSDTTGGTNVIFDNDDAVDQAFTVTLEHTYVTVTPKDQIKEGTPINQGKGSATYTEGATPEALQHDVKRNIHYVVSNGKKAAPADVNDILHYEASAVIDKVTGDVVKTTWSGNQDFKDVASPDLKGYTVDKTLVSNKNISHDHADIKEVVRYSADAQKAYVTYIDDTTGKNLDIKVLKGFTLDDSGYNTKSDIKGYVDLGYDLVSDSSNGAEIIFDDEDGVDQAYTVHLAHGKITVTEEKPGKPGEPINPGEGSADWPDGTDKGSLGKDVVRTITYKMVDGSKAPEGTSQTLHFTASKVIDKVTGQVLETTWSGTQDFKDVESPSVKGYTPDQKVISDKGITHEHSNIDEVVTYVPDPQKALVTYYDDTNGKVLKADSLVGVTNKDSGYTTKGSIAGYINLGFKLVSDETGGKSIVFDNDDSHDQAYSVHLAHDYITVTPEEPGKPGQPINPDANGPKYPGDTDVKGLTDIVNREIDYVMSDGSKAPAAVKDSLSFTAKKTIDKATGEVVKTEWSANQDFKDVESPQVAGYTADTKTVSNKDIAHDAADIKVVVKYTADAQKAAVTYIDDNTGKSLKVDNLDGVTNAKSGYTTKSAIDTYTSLGYTLVSDDTNGAEVVFDNDDKVDQAFTVHFSHGTITVTPENPGKPGQPINPGKGSANYPDDTDVKDLTDTVNRTITYVMSDGSKAPDAVKDSLSYTASKVIDKVTGEVLETKWSANQDFKDVTSPAVKGYTADTKTVSNKDVAHDAADISVVVNYAADKQKASVTYIDDTTGKSLKVDNLDGVTNAKSGYTTKSAIDTYTSLGYTLVSDDTNGAEVVFDNDDAVDQAFTVHLGHGTITVTPENPGKPGEPINPGKGSANYPDDTDVKGLTDTVNRTITYVMSDGSKAPDAVKDSLSFTAKKTIDKATGEVVKTEWSANQDFKDVESPQVAGYTADTKTVSNKDIAHDAADIKVVVKYTADAQKAAVTYIDDNTGKSLKVDNLDGVTNAKSGYTTKSAIDTYTSLGYTLVSDDTNGAEVVFDNDDKVDQAFTVHFSHGTITVTPENPGKPGQPINPGKGSANYPDDTDVKDLTDTVNRTITYVMSDGSKAPDAVKDSLSYTASKVIDKVTGEVLETKWSANQDFKDVTSPAVKGYTADTKTVSNKDVAHDAADISVVVNYAADKQKASVTYIDDTTGKSLKVDNLDGVTNAKSGYTTKSAIDTYTSLGYTLVSDDTNGAEVVFDNDDAVDQAFTVHLGHGTITVTPENPGKPGEPINPGKGSANYPDDTDVKGLTDTVNRTITYVMSDGSKAPDAVKDTLSYTASKVIDKVTGEVISTTWSKNQDFKDVDSPAVAGYTADTKTVSNKDVAHDASDISVVVNYKADAQKASVTYIDDKTGAVIETKNLEGVSNGHSGYSTISKIKELENKGYVLVSDDTTGSEIVFDTDDAKDQAYSVHFKHGTTTVTPLYPKNPVNGNDMTNDLTKKVHQTIKYVETSGKRAAKSNIQTLTFNRNATVDLVDGSVLSYTDWDGPKSTKAVASPKVKGFKADKAVIESHSYTAQDSDKTFTVTYKAVKKAAPKAKETPAPKAPAKKVSGKTAAPAKAPAAKPAEKTAPKAAPAASAETTAKAADKQTQAALPQTGESNDKAALAGLGLASILAGIGILGGQKRKKKEN